MIASDYVFSIRVSFQQGCRVSRGTWVKGDEGEAGSKDVRILQKIHPRMI